MKAPVLFDKKEYCCGCGACLGACNLGAITMQCDEYGFEYPIIDESKCVGCGKCQSACGYNNPIHVSSPMSAHAVVSSSTNVLDSASGGLFACVAKEILKVGEVAGACLEATENGIEVHHIKIDNESDLHKLMGSKYVQSDTRGIFESIKQSLKEGKRVLFSGTPCQVSSLYSYLGGDNKNLYTMDLICHGVPSQKMFLDYLDLLSGKYGDIKDFCFRDKRHGLTFVSKAMFNSNGKDKTKYIQYGESSYYSAFLNGDNYRDCCYSCKFASPNRVGDITIGDFWGIEKQHPELFGSGGNLFDSEKGISSLLINTEKGKELIQEFGGNLITNESTFDKIAEENGQLLNPSVPKGNRDKLFEIYRDQGYLGYERYFRKAVGIKYYVAKLKANLPTPIYYALKKLLRK